MRILLTNKNERPNSSALGGFTNALLFSKDVTLSNLRAGKTTVVFDGLKNGVFTSKSYKENPSYKSASIKGVKSAIKEFNKSK